MIILNFTRLQLANFRISFSGFELQFQDFGILTSSSICCQGRHRLNNCQKLGMTDGADVVDVAADVVAASVSVVAAKDAAALVAVVLVLV